MTTIPTQLCHRFWLWTSYHIHSDSTTYEKNVSDLHGFLSFAHDFIQVNHQQNALVVTFGLSHGFYQEWNQHWMHESILNTHSIPIDGNLMSKFRKELNEASSKWVATLMAEGGRIQHTAHVKSSSLAYDIPCLGNESLKARMLVEVLAAGYLPNQAGTPCSRTEVTVASVKSLYKTTVGIHIWPCGSYLRAWAERWKWEVQEAPFSSSSQSFLPVGEVLWKTPGDNIRLLCCRHRKWGQKPPAVLAGP